MSGGRGAGSGGPTGGSGGRGPGGRGVGVRVRTAKGRRKSSTLWLQRQLNDPYVARAKREGWRSRAAFKLIELDERFHVLPRSRRILDLGAAPGGWTQVAARRAPTGARIVAADILTMDPVDGAEGLLLDVFEPDAPERLRAALGGPADLVLSDMAPSTTGHLRTDQIRIVALVEAAWDIARRVLAPGGTFVAKVFQSGADATLMAALKRDFAEVRHAKPPASRKESAEMYLVATGFRGVAPGAEDGDAPRDRDGA